MKSSNTSAGMVVSIMAIVVGLVTLTVTFLVANTGVTGTPQAGNTSVDRNDMSKFYELDGIDSAPAQWWSTNLATAGLEAYQYNTTTVDGDPLIYLADPADPSGPGEIVRYDVVNGQPKWRAKLDYPASCTPTVRGRYLPCDSNEAGSSTLRYVDLENGAVTAPISTPNEITSVTPVDRSGTEFVVAVKGNRPGEMIVHRGTPTDIDSVWSATYRVTYPDPPLYVDSTGTHATLGFGSKPGESATFALDTGTQIPDPSAPSDPDLWAWSDRTKIRIVDRQRRTFEILDANGAVVGRGADAGNHSYISRLVGTAREDVVLVGNTAYDASSGRRLWSDERLMRSDSDPLSGIQSAVTAIVDDTVILDLRDDYPAGSLIGLDLTTGKQLWHRDYQSMPVQMFLDGTRWVSIIDDELQSFDTRTGRQVWSVDYPHTPTDHDSTEDARLSKTDGKHLVVTTPTTLTVFGPA
ncbi:PQQ-like beta-propeller repeat protein [Gordonia sp. HY285]|uniref:outer membrane protein assembly factor BamB family protein n=1 Tax=Gordonia liuliyuniae TaxID=2911517 RepID=UPI001F2F79A4|nr:PQQ-binding-like beta-propeller repeat protein [Gordonia liuliyuniae]MCF8608643.1 PQQ-like beta-propeller repeat protein [Gordonia liuliyuniae]